MRGRPASVRPPLDAAASAEPGREGAAGRFRARTAEIQPQPGHLLGLGLGSIAVIGPDGTGLRTLTAPGVLYQYSPRWSPDGRWIVACEYQKIHLIEVATGLVIEFPDYFEGIASAAWKPGALLQ